MGKYFDEIMRISDKGYIDRFDDIDEITDKIMNTTVEELEAVKISNASVIAGNLLFYNDLPEDRAKDIRLFELLNLTAQLVGTNKGDDYLSTYAALAGDMFLAASMNIFKFKLFLSISVRFFTDFLDRRARTSKCSEIYYDIQEIASNDLSFTIQDSTTIGELLKKLMRLMTGWCVGRPVEEFISRRESCRNIITMLLIDCMRIGYRENFNIRKLKQSLCEASPEEEDEDTYCNDTIYECNFSDDDYFDDIDIDEDTDLLDYDSDEDYDDEEENDMFQWEQAAQFDENNDPFDDGSDEDDDDEEENDVSEWDQTVKQENK